MSGRPVGGATGAVVSAAAATPTFVTIPAAASGFWVHTSAAAFLDVRASNADTTNLTVANSQPLAGSSLYGEFGIFRTHDKYIAVAGNGGAATVTITFVV